MKTAFFNSVPTYMLMLALMFFATSCDKKLHKEGNGIVTTEERTVSAFGQVDADGKFHVRTHYSDTPHITISTDENIQQEVRAYVQNSKLFLEMNGDYLTYDPTQLTVDVYTNNITLFDLDGQVDLDVLDTLHTSVLTVNHFGRGNANVLFEGDHLTLRVNGSADMTAQGHSDNASFYIQGEGKISGLGHATLTSDAHINGNGKIYVNCSQHLDATIDGSGDIYYLGSPSVTTEIHGSGSVQQY